MDLRDILLFLAVILTAWWFIPVSQTSKFKKLKDASGDGGEQTPDLPGIENEYRKTFTQLIVGSLVLGSTAVTLYQTMIKKNDDDVSNGLKQLQSEKPLERLAGIIELGDWAKAHPDQSSFLPMLFIHFVKEHAAKTHAPWDCSSKNEKRWANYSQSGPSVAPDVQLALDYLRKKPIPDGIVVNLEGLELVNADFSGLNARNISFAFSNLSGAKLNKAEFENADFYCANLYGSHLQHLKVDGDKWDCADRRPEKVANFSSVQADWADFKDAELKNANFNEAHLNNSKFEPATTEGACFKRVNFDGVDLKRINNKDTGDFTEACVWLSGWTDYVRNYKSKETKASREPKTALIKEIELDYRPAWCR